MIIYTTISSLRLLLLPRLVLTAEIFLHSLTPDRNSFIKVHPRRITSFHSINRFDQCITRFLFGPDLAESVHVGMEAEDQGLRFGKAVKRLTLTAYKGLLFLLESIPPVIIDG